ncbi:hypothetical protein C8Q80DRAFT_1192209 [Daedaleopsis nitida]|nr:hypothetical protein C8Q80DRAFT_1192209 [Daedaleopsis nitida]
MLRGCSADSRGNRRFTAVVLAHTYTLVSLIRQNTQASLLSTLQHSSTFYFLHISENSLSACSASRVALHTHTHTRTCSVGPPVHTCTRLTQDTSLYHFPHLSPSFPVRPTASLATSDH